MINIKDKCLCSGCGACALKCPVKAISMDWDKEGFYYPNVNMSLCVDCGLCEKICPYIHSEKNNELNIKRSSVQKTFGAYNTDSEIRELSSSGGIFGALARFVLNNGGVVFGAAFNDKFGIEHTYVENEKDLPVIIGSKYAQSKIGTAYADAERFLKEGRNVLFSGMACQIEGLMAYMGKEYDNLITVDLICMGVPSPMVWDKYLSVYFKGEHIKYINFKDKSIGWNRFCMKIDTDKRTFKEVGMKNLFMRCMFEKLTLRPSCYSCPYKKIYRVSDITLADCWGAEKLVDNKMIDNRGLSTVVVHSKKGLDAVNTIKNSLEIVETDLKKAVENNENMYRCVKANKMRSFFFWGMRNLSPMLMFRIFGSSFYFRLRRKIGRITERIGL